MKLGMNSHNNILSSEYKYFKKGKTVWFVLSDWITLDRYLRGSFAKD